MARITIQMGHVPRRSGATGTYREQEFTRTVGPRLAADLRARGHTVHLIGADDPVPNGDVFISLHTDSGSALVSGPGQSARRGASIGYPEGYDGALGKAWKRHHQRQGFPGGFLSDNYTSGLRRYYSWPHRSRGATRAKGYRHWHLAEHGTTTHRGDEVWLFSNVDRCVAAHVDAVGEVVGHPRGATAQTPPAPIPTPAEEEHVTYQLINFPGVNTVGLVNHCARWYSAVPSPGALKAIGRYLDLDLEPRPTVPSAFLRSLGYEERPVPGFWKDL